MLKLMKLELKKINVGIKGIIIANLIILGILLLIIFNSNRIEDVSLNNYKGVFTSTLVRSVFTIFTAVMISKLVIGEYRNKTINIMFIYPIKRKKIMLAKLFIAAIFAFVTMFLSNLFLDFSVYILNIFINFIKEPFTLNILLERLINNTIYSVAYAFISLIPVYFGMIKKSRSWTIVSSIILVSVLNNGNEGNSLSSIIIIPIIFGILGVISSYMAIRNIDKEDVIT